MPHERHERLADARALGTLERRLRGQPLGDGPVEVEVAVVVVERPPVHEDLVADFAVVRLGLVERPRLAELVLHEAEDVLVAEAVVPAEVHDVTTLKRAVGALEGPGVGDALHDLLAEVGEEVDALVADLVDGGGELLAAELAGGHGALDVDVGVDREGSEVRDVLENCLN